MTWIVGATAFNGLVCVADVQATFEYIDKSRKPRYFNCVRKLHKVYQNLYIGFSGDIRSGLLMIERLKAQMEATYGANELFDIEGQLSILQAHLVKTYREFNPNKGPQLDLMFFWLKQEGESPLYEPACMRFIAPHFGTSGIGPLQINQSGSGKHSAEFQALVDFLSGRPPREDLREKIFGNISVIPSMWTASKIRTLLVKEGSNVSHAGVSKTFLSVVAELGWNKTVSGATHERVMNALQGFGFEKWQEKTRADTLHMYSFDLNEFIVKIAELVDKDPEKLNEIVEAIHAFKAEENLTPLCELPDFNEVLHHHDAENISISNLCSRWSDMEEFMIRNGIRLGECTATA
ncbi:hypothetical protein [Pseudoduganella violacea]|uniref:Uncharacterized protein n=1 Tax=Pseudoduganella violacea TaxID=1715466 RepID=A0A7W5BFY2_9BURK|nr:hypothetical protein [Pseudoduganella violacea]MBB3122454.1 hypothetical protein [Pseudoduganella violacea]